MQSRRRRGVSSLRVIMHDMAGSLSQRGRWLLAAQGRVLVPVSAYTVASRQLAAGSLASHNASIPEPATANASSAVWPRPGGSE